MTKSKKLVCIWATASIIAALAIHGLFHLNAPNEWFIAAWSAGDILTYFSTVTLGLLAVWQNGKIQKSNEESQARLEKISKEANKLNIVGKIIEHETARISKLESLFDEFEICCDPKNIEEISCNNNVGIVLSKSKELYQKVELLHTKIFKELVALISNDDITVKMLNDHYSKLYHSTIKILNYLTSNTSSLVDDAFDKQNEAWINFRISKLDCIFLLQSKLDKVLYEDLTLEEVRILYKGKGGKPSNDQNETGNA